MGLCILTVALLMERLTVPAFYLRLNEQGRLKKFSDGLWFGWAVGTDVLTDAKAETYRRYSCADGNGCLPF